MIVDFFGLMDLWNDYTSAIRETKVDMKDCCICQVRDIRDGMATVMKTDIYTLSRKNGKMPVPSEMEGILRRTGYFLYSMTDKKRYLLSKSVKSRGLKDLFGLSSKEEIFGYSNEEEVRNAAKKMRKTEKVILIAKRPMHGYSEVVGIKTAKIAHHMRAIDLAEEMDKKFGHKVLFVTPYPEQKRIHTCFAYICEIGRKSKNGVPLTLIVKDYANGRQSMTVDIAARIGTSCFILDSLEISHAKVTDPQDILKQVEEKLEKFQEKEIRTNLSAEEIVERCKDCIPTRGRRQFSEAIYHSKKEPLIAACEIPNRGIFNLFDKEHVTQQYDGGRRKYEIKLGSLLIA